MSRGKNYWDQEMIDVVCGLWSRDFHIWCSSKFSDILKLMLYVFNFRSIKTPTPTDNENNLTCGSYREIDICSDGCCFFRAVISVLDSNSQEACRCSGFINDESCRVISSPWYAWWGDEETKLFVRLINQRILHISSSAFGAYEKPIWIHWLPGSLSNLVRFEATTVYIWALWSLL